MNTTTLIIAIAVVVVIALLVAWLLVRRRRTEQLRGRFGKEYERTVREVGDQRKAEDLLADRQERVAAFRIRALSRDEAARYRDAWRRVQARFVDEPREAVADADRIITDVMHTRGYPTADFEARTEHLSVDHARTVEHYRAAHAIVDRQDRGQAGTEDLRQAMMHFRALFDDLVGAEDADVQRKRA